MNIPSLLRSLRKKFFAGTTPRRKPFRRGERLGLEMLETRLVPAVVLPPTIIAVTPPNAAVAGDNTSNPAVTIQFSEAMNQGDVTDTSNYLIFNSEGAPISVTQVNYDTATNTATVIYSPGVLLPVDAYSLFVKGDQIHEATNKYTLANPGQLVTTNAGPSTVSTIDVAGDGTLNAIASYPVGQSVAVSPTPPPLLVTVGDFNGDGINDVAILNKQSERVLVYSGLGNGTFNTTPDLALNLPVGLRPDKPVAMVAYNELTGGFGFAAGLDLAVTDQANNRVIVFQNTSFFGGPPSFAAPATYTATASPQGSPQGLVAADLDGDGITDLAVVDTVLDTAQPAGQAAHSDWEIDVLGGVGDGTFNAAVPITVGTGGILKSKLGLQNPNNLAAGFLKNLPNVGGQMDLAVTGSNGVMALINTTTAVGKFTFQGTGTPSFNGPFAPLVNTTSTVYDSVQIGQIAHPNGSNTVGDIVVGTSAAGTITVFPNTGSGSTFGNGQTITLGQAVPGFTLAALGKIVGGKAGGNNDIILATPGANSFTVIPNTSPGTGAVSFGVPTSYRVDNGPVSVAVGDIDGDRNPDVVTVNTGITSIGPSLTGQSFSVARGNGDGTFKVATTTQQAVGSQPVAVTVGDVNGDGIADYVVANAAKDQVEVYLGVAPSGPGSFATYGAPVIYSVLDRAGKGHHPVSVALANLTGTVNANGLPVLDIVTADSADNLLSILPNSGTGTFGQATTVAVGFGPTQVIAGLFKSTGGKKAQDLIVAHNGVGSVTSDQGVTVLINANTGNRTFLPAVEYGAGKHATAVIAGDFNNDGVLDFAFTDAQPNNGPGSVFVLAGHGVVTLPGPGQKPQGDGTFTAFGPAFGVAPDPTSLAVADVNADGYLDIIAGSGDANLPGEAISVLLNTVGDNFQPAIFSALPGGGAVQSLAVTDLVEDKNSPYPDLVVSVAPAAPGSQSIFVDNYVTLQGAGDGHFFNGALYEAGGPPTNVTGLNVTSPVAVVSDPFIHVTTFFKGGNLVAPNLIVNGNFNTPDFSGEFGNLVGWQAAKVTDSRGAWNPQTGTVSPLSETTVPRPSTFFQAMLDQSNIIPIIPGGSSGPGLPPFPPTNHNPASSYSGSNFLYQDVTLPATLLSAKLNMTLFLDNLGFNGAWATGPASPATTLDYRTTLPNQQVRVDLVNPDAPISDNTPFDPVSGTGTVYMSLFATTQSTPLETTINLSNVDVSSLAGKRVRLRIAAVNNQGPLIVGVDGVSLNAVFADTQKPTVSGPSLRNPGFLKSVPGLANPVPDTNDPTFVGQVNPAGADGGVDNVAFLAFSYTDSSRNPKVVRTNFFDALGHYSVTLPDLPFGLNTINVTVQDHAGNTTNTTVTFFYQGPSVTGWQAVGPGAINTAGEFVTYSTVSGRVTTTVTDPSDPTGNTYYVGAANGGVWRTTDGGANWTPLADFVFNQNGQGLNIPVGAIALAKTNPLNEKVIYVGTGDSANLADSHGGVGVLLSIDGGVTWQVAGGAGPNGSAAVLSGARISAMAVDPNNAAVVYVAVAAGGLSGPGVYKSSDFGTTWTNMLTYNSMNLGNLSVKVANGGVVNVSLPSGTPLASVTSLIIDPRNSNDITIGMGNVGLPGVPASPTAGVWKSSNFGNTWVPIVGWDDPRIPNDGLPTDLQNDGSAAKPFRVGRVVVAQGTGIGADISTFYVLVGNPPPANVGQGGTFDWGNGLSGNYGNTTVAGLQAGLYKTSNGGLDWTKVMIRTNVGGDLVPSGSGLPPPDFRDVNLLGNDSANVGSLVVDPTDPNVVYVGGADNALQLNFNGNETGIQSPGLIRVDTGDMMDALQAKEHGYITGPINWNLNNGDDIQKSIAGQLAIANVKAANAYPTAPSDGGVAYTGEGVSWFDLETGTYSPTINDFFFANIPGQITNFAIDPLGRLLVGTDQGLYRVENRGVGYDFVSGINWLWGTGAGILTDVGSFYGIFVTDPPPGSVTVTPLNGNLQISNLTSVAIDPVTSGIFYTAGFDTGTQMTSGAGLTAGWQTMGLEGGIGPYNTQLGINGTQPGGEFNNDAGTVLTGPTNPQQPPGSLTTVYANYAFTKATFGFDPVQSVLGGAIGSFSPVQPNNAGISVRDNADYLPVMVIDPVPVLDSGVYQNILAYGTDRVYTTRTGSNLWDDRVGHALSTQGGVITALAIAPSNQNNNQQVFYAGSNLGEVWVSTDNGTTWPLLASGLPAARVTSITVNPNNPLVAYLTFGGSGNFAHVWATNDGGKSWRSIQGNLPAVAAYSVVTDPRSQPQVGAPFGHLYVGTEIGVYVSTNGGVTWQHLGQGLPNVPVVAMQFNKSLEELVVATQGRGAFMISTDVIGAHVVSTTPTTPVRGGTSSVTVTFNKAIGTFPLTSITIKAPDGSTITPIGVTDVSVTPALGTNPHDTWQIFFPPLLSDGTYTISIGPNVLDLLGNKMDQNQNQINGEIPGDIFRFQVVVNSNDDGAFISGLYHDLLNTAAPTPGFVTLLNLVDGARFGLLPTFANSFVASKGARTQLITDLYNSASGPLGIGNLLGTPPPTSELNVWLNQLANGASVESIIANIMSWNSFFTQPSVGGTDTGFINQAYQDLLATAPPGSELTFFQNQLLNAEQAARLQVALQLVHSQAYVDTYVTDGYATYLGGSPSPQQLANWERAFAAGETQQQFIATLMGTRDYFNNAPSIIGSPGTTPTNATFIEAVFQQLFNGTPGTPSLTPDQLNTWLNRMAGGMTQQQVAAALLATPDFLRVQVNLAYGLLPNHPGANGNGTASAADLNFWVPKLLAGYPLQNMTANILASAEYFNDHSPAAPTTLAAQDDAWWAAAYQAEVGVTPPPPTPTQLASAESAARQTVAKTIMTFPAYRVRLINNVYQALLSKAPPTSELNYWANFLAGPSTGPGKLSRDEQMIATILSWKEYFNDQTDADGLHTNTTWVDSLYPALGLTFDTTAAANIVKNLQNAYAPARQQAAQILLHSAAFAVQEVTADYNKYIFRTPPLTPLVPVPNSVLSPLVNQLLSGVSRETEIASLISLPIYFLHSNTAIGSSLPPSNTTFVEAAYQDVFDGTVTPSQAQINNFAAQLNSGKLTRFQFALSLTTSPQYLFTIVDANHGLVNSLYNKFLGTNVPVGLLNYWASVYAHGGGDNDVITALVITNEYFEKQHPFP